MSKRKVSVEDKIYAVNPVSYTHLTSPLFFTIFFQTASVLLIQVLYHKKALSNRPVSYTHLNRL